jgi:hypothetical protein
MIYSGKKLLYQKRFEVDTTRALKVQLGNLVRDTASVTDIIINRGLILKNTTLYKVYLQVLSFKTSFLGPNSEAIAPDIPTDGNLLTPAQINTIKTLKRGQRIEFNHILVGGADARRREYAPFSIVIK